MALIPESNSKTDTVVVLTKVCNRQSLNDGSPGRCAGQDGVSAEVFSSELLAFGADAIAANSMALAEIRYDERTKRVRVCFTSGVVFQV